MWVAPSLCTIFRPYEYLIKAREGVPSYKAVVAYIDEFADDQYVIHKHNCATFVLDVVAFTGHPEFDEGTGELSGIQVGNGTTISAITPSALGEDLRHIAATGLVVIRPPRPISIRPIDVYPVILK